MNKLSAYRERSLITVGPDFSEKEIYRVVSEERMRIFLNRHPLVEMQYLPGKERELGAGFLRSAGLIRHKNQIRSIIWDWQNSNLQVEAEVSEDEAEDFLRHLTLGSGCGLSLSDTDVSSEEALKADIYFDRDLVRENLLHFLKKSRDERAARGVHSAALYLERKRICRADDIGRHNAVDKVLGGCLLQGVDVQEAMLLTTGRLTFEMVVKAIRNKVCLVATRSVASTMAVELAEKFGLCLIGILRGEVFTVFSATDRLNL